MSQLNQNNNSCSQSYNPNDAGRPVMASPKETFVHTITQEDLDKQAAAVEALVSKTRLSLHGKGDCGALGDAGI